MRFLLIVLLFLLIPVELLANWQVGDMDWESTPRMLYGKNGDVVVREKIYREPYSTLYRSIKSQANSAYDLTSHEISPEQRRANIAKQAAFVYAMNRDVSDDSSIIEFESEDARLSYGCKSELMLVNMITTSRMGGLVDNILDIHTAQELQLYLTAYDILRGADYPFESEELIVDNLVMLTADFYSDWVKDQFPAVNALNNNHSAKSAAAIGVAAIVLNGYQAMDDPEGFKSPENWIKFAVVWLDKIILDAMITSDGAFGEGPIYYYYSGINHTPFFRALSRYTNGAGISVDGFDYGDLLHRQETKKVHDWLVRIQLPDGSKPPIDDSDPGSQYNFGYVTDFENGGLYRWAWERQRTPCFASGSIDQRAETIVLYDDSVEAISPVDMGWNKNQFSYDGEYAVFRSSWTDKDALYMYMASEHGKAKCAIVKRNGDALDGAGGHDHNDPGAIHFMAYGKPLLIDPGYLGWPKHSMVNDANNHNLVLIDNKGPALFKLKLPELIQDENGEWVIKEGDEGGYNPGKDGDAYLYDFFEADKFSYAKSDTSYFVKTTNTELSRHVLFIEEKFFAVIDHVLTTDQDTHDISVLWHGMGGGESGGVFELLDNGATWTKDEVKVKVDLSSLDGSLDFEESLDYHDGGGRQEKTHSVLKSTINKSGAASILSLIFAAKEDDDFPEIKKQDSGWQKIMLNQKDSGSYLGLINSSVPKKLAACDHLAMAETFFCNMSYGTLKSFFGVKLTELKNTDGKILFEADKEIRIFADYVIYDTGMTLKGNVGHVGLDGVRAKFYLPERLFPLTKISGVCDATFEGDILTVEFMRAGDFEINFNTDQKNHYPLAIADVQDSVTMGDKVVIDMSNSCSTNELQFDYKFTVKPSFSKAEIIKLDQHTASFVTDYYGRYVVEISADDGTFSDVTYAKVYAFADDGEHETELENEFSSEGDGDYELMENDKDIERAEFDSFSETEIDGDLDGDLDKELEQSERDEGFLLEDTGCSCKHQESSSKIPLLFLFGLMIFRIRRVSLNN